MSVVFRLLMLALVCLPSAVSAQGFRAHVEVLGDYAMLPSLRAFQSNLAETARAAGLQGTETLSQFPPYVGLRVFVGGEISFNSPHAAGITLSTSSTGARTAYRDRSGAYYADQQVRYQAVGFLYEYTLNPAYNREDAPITYVLSFNPMAEWATLRHEERLTGPVALTAVRTFTTLQPGVEVGGNARIDRGAVYLRIGASALWRMPRVFKNDGKGEDGLLTTGGTLLTVDAHPEPAESNGFGVRLSLGVGLTR